MGFRTLKRLALGCVPHSAVPALPSQDAILKETECKLLVCTSQAVPFILWERGPHWRAEVARGKDN